MLTRNMVYLYISLLLLLLFSVGGCGQGHSTSEPAPTSTASTSPQALFEKWLTASRGMNSSHQSYRAVLEFARKGTSTIEKIEIEGEVYQKGDRRMEEAEFLVGDNKQKVREYLYGDEIFVANNVEGKWVSQKVTPPLYFNRESRLDRLKELSKKGALVFDDRVRRANVLGVECGQINATVDQSRLQNEDKRYLIFEGGFANFPTDNLDLYIKALQSFEMKLCLLPDNREVETDVIVMMDEKLIPPGGIVMSHVFSFVSRYEVNPDIEDSVFSLPD